MLFCDWTSQALRTATASLQAADKMAAAVSSLAADTEFMSQLEEAIATATESVGVFEEQLCTVARMLVFGQPATEEPDDDRRSERGLTK